MWEWRGWREWRGDRVGAGRGEGPQGLGERATTRYRWSKREEGNGNATSGWEAGGRAKGGTRTERESERDVSQGLRERERETTRRD